MSQSVMSETKKKKKKSASSSSSSYAAATQTEGSVLGLAASSATASVVAAPISSSGSPPNSGVNDIKTRPLLHYMEISLGSQSRKAKYTCVDASENFLACGASNGSVYLYARSGSRLESVSQTSQASSGTSANGTGSARPSGFAGKYHLVKMIPAPSNDKVAVSCVSICPLQKHLAVGTTKGIVYAIQLSDYNKIGEKVEFRHDFHVGFPITCFLWDSIGLRLFAACNGGNVTQTTIRAGMSAIFGSTDTELLLKEQSGIVQMDFGRSGDYELLLVSSQLRVLVLNLTLPDGNVVQVGSKARQGNYGACLCPDPSSAFKNETRVFSARPGRRVWVADPSTGTVSSTLKFSVTKQPSGFRHSPQCEPLQNILPRDLTINKLALFRFLSNSMDQTSSSALFASSLGPQLISWNVGSSVLFLLDPIGVEIVEWHVDLGVIHDLKILNESVLLVLHGEQRKISIIQSCTARQFLDHYAPNNLQKSIELALELQMNDAMVLETLKVQWLKSLEQAQVVQQEEEESSSMKTQQDDAVPSQKALLTQQLDELLTKAKEYAAKYQAQLAEEQMARDSTPLQIIFKQRPQQKPSETVDGAEEIPAKQQDDVQQLGAGGEPTETENAQPPVDFSDALAPSMISFSKNIYAPDGTKHEAKLIEIPELRIQEPVVRLEYRRALMNEVMEEVEDFNRKQEEKSNLGALAGKLNYTTTAAKALTTFLPGTGMFTNLMEPSFRGGQYAYGDVRAGVYGDFPEFDEDYRMHMPVRDPKECPVLRIAMSATDFEESTMDTEVLLEAISMDIWDTELKYISNLPIDKQLNLPEPEIQSMDSQTKSSQKPTGKLHRQHEVKPDKGSSSPKRKQATGLRSIDAHPTKPTKTTGFHPSEIDTKHAQNHEDHNGVIRRSVLSPEANGPTPTNQRVLQKYLGVNPICKVQHKCMVGGQMASSAELASILEQEIPDLQSELQAAAVAAQKAEGLAKRLWPASKITRITACLCNLYLYQGEMEQVRSSIESWLSCFDPTAKLEHNTKTDTEEESSSDNASGGWEAKGEALLDGGGLPLTRSDWNLVRALVSIYFSICVAGSSVRVRPVIGNSKEAASLLSRPYVYDFGILFEFVLEKEDVGDTNTANPDTGDDSQRSTAEVSSSIPEETTESTECHQPHGENKSPRQADRNACQKKTASAPDAGWNLQQTEAFVAKYGIYLNPEMASEVCTLRRFSSALNMILDQVVSSANMSSTCDDVVNLIAEKQASRALDLLRDACSLCLLLHLLDLLLKKAPQEVIEFCVEKYPRVRPWNLERSLFGGQFDLECHEQELLLPQNLPQTSTYLMYLVTLLDQKPLLAGNSRKLVHRCLELCFEQTVTNHLFEQVVDDQKESTASPSILASQSSLMEWVVRLVRQRSVFAYEREFVWQLFVKNEFMAGLLELVMQQLEEETHVKSATSLTAEGVTKQQMNMNAILSIVLRNQAWHMLFELFNRVAMIPNALQVLDQVLRHLEQTNSIDAGGQLLSRMIIYSLLNAVGITRGMQLLAGFPLLFATTPLSMYHTIVEASLLNAKQADEISHMLEIVDTQLWSSYQSQDTHEVVLAPQIQAVLDLERGALSVQEKNFQAWHAKCAQYDQDIRASEVFQIPKHHHHHQQPGKGTPQSPRMVSPPPAARLHQHQPPPLSLASSSGVASSSTSSRRSTSSWTASSLACRFYDDRNSDWGGDVQLHESVCAFCDLPVVLLDEAGGNVEVLLFPCGHAFHATCLGDRSCATCLASNLHSLTSLAS